MTEMTSAAAAIALEEAEDMLASLTNAKIKGEHRLRELNATRAALAYAGLSPTGTGEDRIRLAQATEQAVLLRAELDNLDFGIVAAQQKVTECRQHAGSETVRLKCEDALQHVADWRHHGGRAASLFAEFIQEYDGAIAASNAIRRLRVCRFPDHEVLETSLKLAISGHLHRRHLHPEPTITSPNSRRELADVIELWANQTEIAIDRVMTGAAPPPVEPEEAPPAPDYIQGEEYLEPDAVAAE